MTRKKRLPLLRNKTLPPHPGQLAISSRRRWKISKIHTQKRPAAAGLFFAWLLCRPLNKPDENEYVVILSGLSDNAEVEISGVPT